MRNIRKRWKLGAGATSGCVALLVAYFVVAGPSVAEAADWCPVVGPPGYDLSASGESQGPAAGGPMCAMDWGMRRYLQKYRNSELLTKRERRLDLRMIDFRFIEEADVTLLRSWGYADYEIEESRRRTAAYR